MSQKRYLTRYQVRPGLFYGGDVWARSPAEADRIAKKRSIGETVIGKGMRTGGLPRARTQMQKLHEAVYLGWIALEMGIMTPKQLLGDEGLIHEMVHRLNGGKVKGLEARFRRLQRSVPGHLPSPPYTPQQEQR